MGNRDAFLIYNSNKLRQRIDAIRARAYTADGNKASRTDILDYAVRLLEKELKAGAITLPSPGGNGSRHGG